MPRFAELDVGGTRDCRPRRYEIFRVEHSRAAFTLVAAGVVAAAVRAGADDVAIGQEAVVGR